MRPAVWLTILEAEPTRACADWQRITRGVALVFCRAADAAAATVTATERMLDQGYTVSAALSTKPCTPDYIRLIQTEARPALAEAQAGGIGIFLAAEPRFPGNPDSPASIHPLQPPFDTPKYRH